MGKNKKISDKPKEILSSMKTVETDYYFTKNNITSIQNIEESLKREIFSNDEEIGFCVNQEYTDIGNNQLFFKNSYETKLIFQTSSYVEPFALEIAINLLEVIEKDSIKEIVLIGYKDYSEFLLYRVGLHLIDLVRKYMRVDISVRTVWAEDDSDGKIRFIGHIEGTQDHSYAIILPINSTLRTNDKIASFWKQMLSKKYPDKTPNESVYNHCAIVVRDKPIQKPTKIEQLFQWKSINKDEKVINTKLQNAKKIHYTIQIASKNDSDSNWINRINKSSFPGKWTKEKYFHPLIERTINTRTILGFPNNVIKLTQRKHIEEIKRLKALKDYIYSGHIEAFGTHHRYYIDAETFISNKNEKYKKWLSKIKNKNVFDLKRHTHILITPHSGIESKFVNNINDVIFDGLADIINLELNDSTENTNSILSHLSSHNSQKVVQYHFVDHVLLTGDTYWRIRSFLNSFADIQIDSIFSLINRTPNSKTNEIKQSVNHNLFTFLTLNYPAIKQNGKECYLCELTKYYETLKEHSVSETCQEVIENNKEKLELKKRSEILDNKDKEENEIRFYRLFLTHELLYLISKNIKNTNAYLKNKATIKTLLDEIYDGLTKKKKYITISSQRIDLSQTVALFDDSYDAKITFIKSLATPPLSDYAIIREYTHKKLLNILYDTLNIVSPTEKDLKLLKSILKSLSYLKSNALIRKEVITKSWQILYKYVENVTRANNFNEKEILKDLIEKFGKDFSFYIKHAIFSDTAKSYYLGELLRTGKEPCIKDSMNLPISETTIDNELFTLFGEKEKRVASTEIEKIEEIVKLKYIDFLKNIFYDNTTILRKTLNNVVFEIKEKNENLRNLFYEKNNKIKAFECIKDSIETICEKFYKKQDNKNSIIYSGIIYDEYYYTTFRPYLENRDEIKYLEKLIYLAYAKLKLNELINHKQGAEQDTKDLIEIFTKIMGADSAFLAMNLGEQPHVISTYGKLSERDEWDYRKWFLQHDYRSSAALSSRKIKAPLILKFEIKDTDIYRGEKRDLRAHSLALYLMGDANKNFGTITFLYYDNNPIIKSGEDIFRVNVQEFGRLLLLLKQDIDKYFIDFLLKEKVLDLWVGKRNHEVNLKKLYTDNFHTGDLVTDEMEQLYTIIESNQKCFSDLKDLILPWYQLSNQLISQLYGNILLRHKSLELPDSDSIQLSKIFTDTFKKMIIVLLDKKWNENRNEENKHKILFDFNDLDTIIGYINKNILMTFIVQHIDNCLNTDKHCGLTEKKEVTLKVNKQEILIQENTIISNENVTQEEMKNFDFIKNQIMKSNYNVFSSTTFTSLKAYIDYLNTGSEKKYFLDFGFRNNNFFLHITYNNNEKDSNI